MSKQPTLEISERQAWALGIIQVLIRRNPDLAPTYTEIAKYMDSTKQAVSQIVAQLERKGYLTRTGGYRSIKLTGKPLPFESQKGGKAA